MAAKNSERAQIRLHIESSPVFEILHMDFGHGAIFTPEIIVHAIINYSRKFWINPAILWLICGLMTLDNDGKLTDNSWILIMLQRGDGNLN